MAEFLTQAWTLCFLPFHLELDPVPAVRPREGLGSLTAGGWGLQELYEEVQNESVWLQKASSSVQGWDL